jgi:hypothetical protein
LTLRALPGLCDADIAARIVQHWILDCADAAGLALSAIRIGQRGIVLDPSAPGHGAVAAIAHAHGIVLLAAAPPALDLAARGARRQLERWLHAGDSGGGLG